jgi:hypothetical protein
MLVSWTDFVENENEAALRRVKQERDVNDWLYPG